jgi:hypothetical protein
MIENSIQGRTDNIDNMVKHIVNNNIQGDILDIGVFKGYSSILVMNQLLKHNISNRNVYLYDTFEGMPEPTIEDSQKIMSLYKKNWALGTLDEVKSNINKHTKYPTDKIHYIKGMVEDTLPAHTHNQIAYVRLDTDFYSSTKVELETLYDFIVPGGVLIVDDYSSKFVGCTLAVNEFFKKRGIDTSEIIPINKKGQSGMYHIKKFNV